MPTERIVLGDGVYLNLLRCDKFKTNYLSVDFLANLSPERTAAYALLPPVLTRGTERFPDMISLTRELDMLYGSRIYPSVAAAGDVQLFGFTSSPLRSEYADGTDVTGEVLRLIASMLSSPRSVDGCLSSAYTESEKKIMIDRIRARINDKAAYALRRCSELLSEGELSAIPLLGTEEQAARVTAPFLTECLKTARESLRIELYAIGSFDIGRLTALARELFVLPGRRTPAPLVTERNPRRHHARRITETQPITQAKLCLGYRTGCYPEDEALPAYSMLTEVLSGSPTSKLFMNVREKKSLCYYCHASSNLPKATMIVSSGIDAADRERAEEAIIGEIEACARGEITDEELEAAGNSVANSIRAMYDDPAALKSWYLGRGLFSRAMDPDAFLEKLLSVTRDQIAEAAQRLSLDTVYFLEGNGTTEENSSEEEDHLE